MKKTKIIEGGFHMNAQQKKEYRTKIFTDLYSELF